MILSIKRAFEKATATARIIFPATIDYVELYSYPELEPVNEIAGKMILAVAVAFSKARLIDNIIIDIREMERI